MMLHLSLEPRPTKKLVIWLLLFLLCLSLYLLLVNKFIIIFILSVIVVIVNFSNSFMSFFNVPKLVYTLILRNILCVLI